MRLFSQKGNHNEKFTSKSRRMFIDPQWFTIASEFITFKQAEKPGFMEKLLFAFLAFACGHAIAADAKPNVVLILIDDFGYECVTAESLDDAAWDVARIILSRSARSARRTTHFDLDFPRKPVKKQ